MSSTKFGVFSCLVGNKESHVASIFTHGVLPAKKGTRIISLYIHRGAQSRHSKDFIGNSISKDSELTFDLLLTNSHLTKPNLTYIFFQFIRPLAYVVVAKKWFK